MQQPWTKEALLQKYSVRQSSKASLQKLAKVQHMRKRTYPGNAMMNLIDRLNLQTIKSYNDVNSSLHHRGSEQDQDNNQSDKEGAVNPQASLRENLSLKKFKRETSAEGHIQDKTARNTGEARNSGTY